MIADDSIGYGLKDGVLTYIEDVPRGLACGCVCARCGRVLIAKKGKVRQHHFAHHESVDCHGAVESVLHRLAKELIHGMNEIQLPPYAFRMERRSGLTGLMRHQAVIAKGGQFRYRTVRVEESVGSFVPDLVLEADSLTLIVEIAVTHKVSREKLRKIRKHNKPAIEVRLDAGDSFLPRDLLQEKLQLDLTSKAWLFHPGQRWEEQVFFKRLRQARSSYRRLLKHEPWDENAGEQVSLSGRHGRQSDGSLSTGSGSRSFQEECDRTINEFLRANGRQPTMEECIRLWPRLWKR